MDKYYINRIIRFIIFLIILYLLIRYIPSEYIKKCDFIKLFTTIVILFVAFDYYYPNIHYDDVYNHNREHNNV